jgi:TolB-like protein
MNVSPFLASDVGSSQCPSDSDRVRSRVPSERRTRIGLRGAAITIGAIAAMFIAGGIILGQILRNSDASNLGGENSPEQTPANDSSGALATQPDQKKLPGEERKGPTVFPMALFVFQERGHAARDMGAKISDLLFAKLGARAELHLVDREELKKTLDEQELNLSGAVKPADATKIGQLTGAKLLLTGSVVHVDKQLILIAKLIGTETSRVVSASVEGKVSDELSPLVDKLAEKVTQTIKEQADQLVAKETKKTDRIAVLKDKLKNAKKPVVMVQVKEQHIGRVTIDPAAETELSLFCKEAGFEIIDADVGARGKADVIISGEGISEFAVRHGNLVSVKARVEVKAVDRQSGKVLAVDRQTAVVVDLTEQLAGKAALQQAAAILSERLLPKLVKE